MIEVWHREHAPVHPCAADESELPRLLAQGWTRCAADLRTSEPAATAVITIVDTLDEAIDVMLREERRLEKQMLVRSKRGGGSAP